MKNFVVFLSIVLIAFGCTRKPENASNTPSKEEAKKEEAKKETAKKEAPKEMAKKEAPKKEAPKKEMAKKASSGVMIKVDGMV